MTYAQQPQVAGTSQLETVGSTVGAVNVTGSSANLPWITVSPIGLAAGCSQANNGAWFGPDSTLYTGTLGTTATSLPFSTGATTTTNGIQEAIVFSEYINGTVGTSKNCPGTILLLPGVTFSGQVFISQSFVELRGTTSNSGVYNAGAPPWVHIQQITIGVTNSPGTKLQGTHIANILFNELDFHPYVNITFTDIEDCGLSTSTTAGKNGIQITVAGGTYGGYVQYTHFKGTLNIIDNYVGGGAINFTGTDTGSATAHWHFDHIVYVSSTGTGAFNCITSASGGFVDRVTIGYLDVNFNTNSNELNGSIINIAASATTNSQFKAVHIGDLKVESHQANYGFTIGAFSGGHTLSMHVVIDCFNVQTANLTIFNNSNTAPGWATSLNEIVVVSGTFSGSLGTMGIVTATAGTASVFVVTIVNWLTLVPSGFGATAVTVPASASASANPNPYPVQLIVQSIGTTFSKYIIIDRQGGSATFTFAVPVGAVLATIPPGGSITPTWTVTAPTWATNGL